MRALAFQLITKFLLGLRWVLGSLLFIADKFGDPNLQEPESQEVDGSSTDSLPSAPVRVGLVNGAQLKHRHNLLGKTDPDPSRDKADHTPAVHIATTDPMHQ